MKDFLKKLNYRLGLHPRGLINLLYYIIQFRFGEIYSFWLETRRYKKELQNSNKVIIYPNFCDKKSTTVIDEYYFYQDVWAAKMAISIKPKKIVDIGSTALLVGFLSQLAETVSIDIRPLTVSLGNLTCKRYSITELPFSDNSIEYINSLCVIEHVGLGRYGDGLDIKGAEKACAELRRVLRQGGYLVASVPLGPSCVVFNAHRIFGRDEFLEMFPGFEIMEEIFCVPEYTKTNPTLTMKRGESHILCVCLRKK